MVESCTTVQVALRIRPLVQTEITRGCQPCVDAVPNESQVQVVGTDKAFTYNFVFGPEENQLTFYNTAVKDLISKLFTGYNVTVLAYGQTGSGKTFSMGTTYSPDTIESNMGVIPRAINDIFEKTKEMENWDFKITVSFMELYKEQLYDLLAPTKCVVDIREDGKGIRIPGLTEIAVMSPEDTTSCLVQGSSCRATGATAMNAQSSRSHAIFTITIYQQKRDAENESMCAKFHLVDLAGSERSKKTQATGERFREGVNINRGLLALGNVISSLGEGHQKSYISYRDSKLTRLLQDSLGGNSITLMIACVSPADYNLEETLSTLRYADRARKIKNKPIINQDPKAAEIANLKHQIQELRLELLARGSGGGNCPPEHTALEKDIASLVMKNRKLTEELNDALSAGTNLFERALMAEVARDRMKVKLCELQAEYGQTMESLSHSVDQENCPATFLEQLKSLRDLQIKIQELQAEQKRSSDEIMNHQITSSICAKPSEEPENDDSFENLPRSESDIDEKHQTHTLQQAERTKELHELNQKLALKEELAAKLMTNMNQMSLLRSDYESSVKDLEQQISVLEKERDELKNVLQNVQSTQNNNNNIKVAEQRKKRLQELEQKISTLCKKLAEQEKIIKLKDKNDEKINKLNNEIQGMKQIKVKLIRQMKSENDRFRTWKLQREKELIKLKEQDRRRLNEMARMERLHTKQQNVLKRKVEEAVAVNKRLKDALAVQKSVQERRAQQHGNANKVHTWIDQEVEVLVRTVEAERTLEQLLEDRGMLHQQLDELQVNHNSGGDSVNIPKFHQIGKIEVNHDSGFVCATRRVVLNQLDEHRTNYVSGSVRKNRRSLHNKINKLKTNHRSGGVVDHRKKLHEQFDRHVNRISGGVRDGRMIKNRDPKSRHGMLCFKCKRRL
ncbi:hypothetical protein C0J52_20777 [Blattella germanica]|nr:hypothetical protein C0J52_20777 [Blattella germanica]